MNEIKKELLHTLVLIKEKEKNKYGISIYDGTGEIDLKYIKEYWGETKEEVEERWLRSFSKQYFILWAPMLIFTFLGIVFGKLMEVDMWYDHPITIITTVIMGLSWSFSIFGAHERRKQARHIIHSLRKRKEKAERERREQQERKRRIRKIEELNKQFGKPFGEYVYDKKVEKGMKYDAVLASWPDPKLKKNNVWYYPQRDNRTLTLVNFVKDKVSSILYNKKPFELDMPKKELIAIWGSPRKTKETVFKTKTKQKLYYFSRKTRQDTTAYGYEVNIEDDIVVGWNELE